MSAALKEGLHYTAQGPTAQRVRAYQACVESLQGAKHRPACRVLGQAQQQPVVEERSKAHRPRSSVSVQSSPGLSPTSSMSRLCSGCCAHASVWQVAQRAGRDAAHNSKHKTALPAGNPFVRLQPLAMKTVSCGINTPRSGGKLRAQLVQLSRLGSICRGELSH